MGVPLQFWDAKESRYYNLCTAVAWQKSKISQSEVRAAILVFRSRSRLLSSFVDFSVQRLQRSEKRSQSIRGRGGHFGFSFGQKNTNFVEDVEFLLPVKFRQIPFSGFTEEVKCLRKSDAGSAILVFRLARKLGRGLTESNTTFRKGQGNSIQVSKIFAIYDKAYPIISNIPLTLPAPQKSALVSKICNVHEASLVVDCKSLTRGWISLSLYKVVEDSYILACSQVSSNSVRLSQRSV